MRALTSVVLVSVTCCCGCAGPASPSSVLGAWGGDHVSMTVALSGSHLEFDCAHGDLPGSLGLDERGHFSEAGTFVREHGGPIRLGEVPDSHPALYAGTVNGDTMTLSVSLTDTGQTIGSFVLVRGSSGRVLKCL